MPEYRRAFEPGGIFFFTVVTHRRKPILCHPLARTCLRQAFRKVHASRPFDLIGIVLLPDHLHCLWQLPEDDHDFSVRWAYIKGEFTRQWLKDGGEESQASVSRWKHRERCVWQKRFWEHTIRDEQDMIRHLDYIHYNPVKHGLTDCPHQWEFSSFTKWVNAKMYEPDWQCCCNDRTPQKPNFETVTETVGE